jgi:uncharacterized repeat protein (TIGR01451 family)
MLRLFRPTLAAIVFIAAIAQSAFASNPPTFFPVPEAFPVTAPAGTLVMGDFDGDGIPDLAVFGTTNNNSGSTFGVVQVLFGDGKGGFRATAPSFTLENSVTSSEGLAAADLDGDGKSELVFAGGNAVLIYDWNGSSFSQTRSISLTASGISAASIAVGDFTGKGNRDILVSDEYGAVGVVLISNDGKGNYGTPAVFPASGDGYYSQPILADVNGDGFADVIMTPGAGIGGSNALVGVLLNNNGTLGAETYYGAASVFANTNKFVSVIGATVADVDGDGTPDLITAVSLKDRATFDETYYLVVNLGNGNGTFKEGAAFPFDGSSQVGITAITTADMNNDGRADIVTSDYFVSGFTVTEWTGTGNTLAIGRQEDSPAYGPPFNTLTVGYKDNTGTLVTFNKDTKTDVLLGTTSFLYLNNSPQHAVYLFTNTTSSGSTTTGNTLPATGLRIVGSVSAGAPINFIATQTSTASGLYVRIQSTTTTNIETSWTDLPGGGRLQSSGTGSWSFGTIGTTSYPSGKGIYFRAISAAPGYTDSISTNRLGPYTLSQSVLTISVKETSTSDPAGKLHIVHIGDKLTYTFYWTNLGTVTAHKLVVKTPVPTYIDATSDLQYQFAKSNLTYNQYGTYETNSSGTTEVWWNVADLPAKASQSVTLTVQVGPSVRIPQALGLPNNYEVYSSTGQPAAAATGYSSGAPNVGDTVLGPISLTITPDVTTAAPGGYINYTITITNLGSSTANDVVIADPVPEFTSFVPYNAATKTGTTFLTAKGVPTGAPAFSVKVAGKATAVANPLRLMGLFPSNSLPAGVKAFLAANSAIKLPSDFADEVVFYVGTLAKGASATVRLTVQVVHEPAGNVTGGAVQNVDYLGYFVDSAGGLDGSENENGPISTTVSGAVVNAPKLKLTKMVSSESVTPGEVLSVVLIAQNTGGSAANDVFVEDSLLTGPYPAGLPVLINTNFAKPAAVTSSTLNSAVEIITGGSSSTMSKTNYFVTLDQGGLITVHGLHLEPGATVGLTYFMQIPTAAPVPESLFSGGCFVGAGNGSQSPEWVGTNTLLVSVPIGNPASYTIDVSGYVQLFTPANPAAAVISPKITTNPTLTSSNLDALFKKNASASLVIYTNIGTKKNIPVAFPGVQRYLLHYQNIGTNAAPDVHLQFATPPNTELYRASFMTGANVTSPLKTQSIGQPGKLGTGNVIFNIGSLSASSGGYCLVEVILLPGAVSKQTAQVIPAAPLIYSGNPPKDIPRKLDDGNSTGGTVVYDGQHVPKAGVIKVVPQYVHTGDTFAVQLAVFTCGDLPQTSEVNYQFPAGTEFVGTTGPGTVLSSDANGVQIALGSGEHYASGVTILLRATGTAGTKIVDNSTSVAVDYCGTFVPMPMGIHVVDPSNTIPTATITTIVGAQFLTIGEMAVIPLGQLTDGSGGTALVCGPASAFNGLEGDTLFSDSDNGNYIVGGRAKDIKLAGLPILNNTDTGTILANIANVVGKQGGNLFNGPEDNLVGPDGVSIIDNDSGGVQSTITALLSAGARSVIASGTGALSSSGSQGSAGVGSGQAQVAGGGNVVTAGGGVALVQPSSLSAAGGELIAQDGNGLIAQDGNGLIAQDGNGMVGVNGSAALAGAASLTAVTAAQSAAAIATTGGNIVAAGGGNIVAQGGGNIVAQGGGNIVAQGGGN